MAACPQCVDSMSVSMPCLACLSLHHVFGELTQRQLPTKQAMQLSLPSLVMVLLPIEHSASRHADTVLAMRMLGTPCTDNGLDILPYRF